MYQWADLPKELLDMISRCLNSRVDVLRFRSVCTSWRSSAPPPSFSEPPSSPLPLLTLPHPISTRASLSETSICRLEMELNQSPSCAVQHKGWLAKVGESATTGKLQLLHPLSNHQIRYFPFPLNLHDIRFVQLTKVLVLKPEFMIDPFFVGLNKVVLFPFSASLSMKNYAILAIYHQGKLGYWKYGDEKWTLLDDKNFEYDDIIVYKGQYYVVDRWGTISWIDSSLKLIQYSPPLFGCGGKKSLVESCGDLYVVDRYLDGERSSWKDYENLVDHNNNTNNNNSNNNNNNDDDDPPLPPFRHLYTSRLRKKNPKAVDFRVYKLDEEWGKWVDVTYLDDRIFVLGMDCCFSVSSREFAGGRGNCIYFTDCDSLVGKGIIDDDICVFQLEDHSIVKLAFLPEHSSLFWPTQHSHHIASVPNQGSSSGCSMSC